MQSNIQITINKNPFLFKIQIPKQSEIIDMLFKPQIAIVVEQDDSKQQFVSDLQDKLNMEFNCTKYNFSEYKSINTFLNGEQQLHEQNNTIYARQLYISNFDQDVRDLYHEQIYLDLNIKTLISADYKEDIYQQWKICSTGGSVNQYSQAILNTNNLFLKQLQKFDKYNSVQQIDQSLSQIILQQILNDQKIFKAYVLFINCENIDQDQLEVSILDQFLKFQALHTDPLQCYCYVHGLQEDQQIIQKLQAKYIYNNIDDLIKRLHEYIQLSLYNQIYRTKQLIQKGQFAMQYVQKNLINYSDIIYAVNRYSRTPNDYASSIDGEVQVQHLINSIIPYEQKSSQLEYSKSQNQTLTSYKYINYQYKNLLTIPQLKIITTNQMIGKCLLLVGCDFIKLKQYQEAVQYIQQAQQKLQYENTLLKSICSIILFFVYTFHLKQQKQEVYMDIQDIICLFQHGFITIPLQLMIFYKENIHFQYKINIQQNLSTQFQLLNFIQDKQVKFEYRGLIFEKLNMKEQYLTQFEKITVNVQNELLEQKSAQITLIQNIQQFNNQGVKCVVEPQSIYSEDHIEQLKQKQINYFEFQQLGQKDIIYVNQLQKIKFCFGWRYALDNQMEILEIKTQLKDDVKVQIICQQIDEQSCSYIVTVKFVCNSNIKYKNIKIQELIIKENNKIFPIFVRDNNYLLLNNYCILSAQCIFEQYKDQQNNQGNIFRIEEEYCNCDTYKLISNDFYQEHETNDCLLSSQNHDNSYETQQNQIEIKYIYDTHQQMKLKLYFDEKQKYQDDDLMRSGNKNIKQIQEMLNKQLYTIEKEDDKYIIQINDKLQSYIVQSILKIKINELTDNIKSLIADNNMTYIIEKNDDKESILILQIYTNYHQLLNQYQISF